MMKTLILGNFLSLLVFLSLTQTVSADLINPEYYSKTCNPGEIEVKCSYGSSTPFGPKTFDECAKYENNPNYRYLVGEGHSFGGSQKFCYKAASIGNFISFHVRTLLPLILITLLLEIPISLVLLSKSHKALFTVILTNSISVPLLYIATVFLPFSGFLTVLVMELIVIVFEAVFIKFMLQSLRLRRILIYSFVANVVSAILGNLVINAINGFM